MTERCTQCLTLANKLQEVYPEIFNDIEVIE